MPTKTKPKKTKEKRPSRKKGNAKKNRSMAKALRRMADRLERG